MLASLTVLAQRPAAAGGARLNIILISVDTLRPDHLSCFSPTAAKTPNIDRIAQGGTRWSEVSSMVPLTLPSHVSMLTSSYPFENGVEDNGDRLEPGAVTLAGTLRSHGYRTAAFLGGFVLDRRFGLDQGFDMYDSPKASQHSDASDPGDIKRRGEEVREAGQAWLTANANRPFFLFLHFYDLHTPYNLDAREQAKYGKGYNGELSYIDDEIGKLWEYLATHGLIDTSLIVFTSDHGEGLGDHGESTHGFFIYQSTIHVPLIMHWPAGVAALPKQVDTPVSLLDVSPTILAAVRIARPEAMHGRSLLAAASGPEGIYSESVYPHKHFDASALASLRSGRYKYIDAPRPELYDLAQDPGETNNLYAARSSLAAAYHERIMQLVQLHKPALQNAPNRLSPEAIESLHALGYLSGGSSAPVASESKLDPKDEIAAYEAYGHAIQLASLGRLDEANTDLSAILEKNSALLDVRLTLGLNEQRQGKDSEALGQFHAVLLADPTNAIAHLDAGLSDYNLRKFDEASKEAKAALAISQGYAKAEVLLAKSLAQQGELAQAGAEFNKILQETPDSYDAHDGLGTLAAMRGDWAESVQQLEAALAVEPNAPETRNTLGSAYLREGQLDLARSQFEQALRLKPNYALAHYNLGLVLLQSNDREGARGEFQKALSDDPEFRRAREALSRLEQKP